ncbi:MAG: hypothetical protein JXR76_04490 [Deltaproteobacteria bacterium]|nr:hypothetical protein [Deltaproteobacteria bacterium]
MPFNCKFFLFGVLLAVAIFAAPTFAYDQQLNATLSASGYSVRAANGTLIDRRTIMQDLYLGAWNILPGSDALDYKGPRLSLEVDLRIGGDYGVSNSEMDAQRMDRFVPGLEAMVVEAVFAYVNLQGLAGDHLDLSAGRRIRSDVIGYAAYDGADVTVYGPLGMRVDGFFGYEVKNSKPFGYDNLALDGTDNVGRDELEDAYFNSLVEPEATMVFGTELSMAPTAWLEGAVAYRQAGHGHKLQQRTIAGRMALGNERVRTFARVVMNPLLDRYDRIGGALREGTLVSEATLEAGAALFTHGWMSVAYELYRPVFALDSIFNLFGQLGRRDVVLRYAHRPSSRMQWALWSNVRFVDDNAVGDDAEQERLLIGGGGGAGWNYGVWSRRVSSRVNVDNELGATRLGVEQELGHRFFDDHLWLSVRGSLWYMRDKMYDTKKTIGGYVVSANYQFNEKARTLLEFENYYGSDIPRFVVTALFQLDVWR